MWIWGMEMAGKGTDIIGLCICYEAVPCRYAQTACTPLHAHVPCEIRSQYSAKSCNYYLVRIHHLS